MEQKKLMLTDAQIIQIELSLVRIARDASGAYREAIEAIIDECVVARLGERARPKPVTSGR